MSKNTKAKFKKRMVEGRISPALLASTAGVSTTTLYSYLGGAKMRDTTVFEIEEAMKKLEAQAHFATQEKEHNPGRYE